MNLTRCSLGFEVRFYLSEGKEMKNSFLVRVGSFFGVTRLNLLAEGGSRMGQPQGGQRQMGSPQMRGLQMGTSSSQGLEAFSLPKGAIAESDIPQIKTIIQQALDKLSQSKKSSGKRADNESLKSGILAFQDWLRRQGCISQASSTYNLEATDKYSDNIFITFPGQLPFDIIFKMGEGKTKQYRILLFISPADFLSFGSLVENKSLGGVPVPPNWPKDTSSYWKDRP
jgi:hypothetical protein